MSKTVLRDVSSLDEYKLVEDLQKEVWGFDERDIVPLTQLIAAKETGGILVGAFDGSVMAGFVYGFVGYEDNQLVIHSHMLAVRPSYQGENLGYELKLAQRERALAAGIRIVTWTFDPLQCLNAHLNIEKLGVRAVDYRVNFYGETSSSLHKGIGTDRLWARWELDDDRVKRCLEGRETPCPGLGDVNKLVSRDEWGMPVRGASEIRSDRIQTIEIPGNIGALQQTQPEWAVQWRKLTREAFLRAFDAGLLVAGFQRLSRSTGVYILSPRGAVEQMACDG